MSGSCFYIIINTKQKHIRVYFFANANKYPLQIFSTSTLLAHSPHPIHSACSFSTSLHPLIHSIRQRRKNAHETVSISASTSTVPVFKFKFLHYAPYQKRQLPCFIDYSAPLFSSRPRTDHALCPGLRVILRALE